MIEVTNLSKSYGPVRAVRDISFRVEAGEIVGFLGPNGAGKTTTMRMLTGFLPPTEGAVKIAGYDVLEQAMEARAQIGYLPENPPVYPELTIAEYLAFVAELKGVARSERNARVDRAIEQLHLGEMRHRMIGRLSKGYRQRVGLAQALIHEPKVMILDEPTVGLDPGQIVEIRNLIRGLAKDRTVILSTHILPEVEAICRRVIIISAGRIAAQGTLEQLVAKSSPMHQLRVVVKGGARAAVEAALEKTGATVTRVAESGAAPDVHEVTLSSPAGADLREAVFRAVVAGGWALLELTAQSGNLEDVFMKLTTREEGVDGGPAAASPGADASPVQEQRA